MDGGQAVATMQCRTEGQSLVCANQKGRQQTLKIYGKKQTKHQFTSPWMTLLDVSNSPVPPPPPPPPPQAGTNLNFDILVTKERNKEGNDARLDNHLYLIIPTIRQVWQSPHCVHQNLEKNISSQMMIGQTISGNWNISETNYILSFPWIFLGMLSYKRNAFWRQQQMQQQSCSSKGGHAVKDQHRNKMKSTDDINQALCDQLSTTICHPRLVAPSDVRDLLTWKQDRETFRESGLTQEWTSIWVLCTRHLFTDLKKEKNMQHHLLTLFEPHRTY